MMLGFGVLKASYLNWNKGVFDEVTPFFRGWKLLEMKKETRLDVVCISECKYFSSNGCSGSKTPFSSCKDRFQLSRTSTTEFLDVLIVQFLWAFS